MNIGIINCLDIITPSCFPLCDSGACKALIRDLGGSDPEIDPGESKLAIQEEAHQIRQYFVGYILKQSRQERNKLSFSHLDQVCVCVCVCMWVSPPCLNQSFYNFFGALVFILQRGPLRYLNPSLPTSIHGKIIPMINDHVRPLTYYITKKRTMSSIIWCWQIQRQRRDTMC